MRFTSFFHHLFIPRESNNFKAKAIHLDFLTFYLVLALILTVAVKQLKTGQVLGFATDINVQTLFQLTNDERVRNNLPPLNYNDQLAAAAQKKAENMFAIGYWAHFAPDGTTPWSFILNQGYQYSVAGENLAKGFYFSSAVVEAWMNSPSHRENLLRDSYKDVGFAIQDGTLNGEETTIVVQMFGAPIKAVTDTTASAQPAAPAEQQQVAQVLPTTAPVITVQPTQAVQTQTNPAKNPYYQPKSTVLAKETGKATPSFNLFSAAFNFNFVFLGTLVIVLFMDFYFTKRMNVLKFGGKNLIHILFILFIIVGVYLVSKGGIIQ